MRISDLENPQVIERLKVNECSQNNAKNEQAFASEEESYKVIGLQTFSPNVISAPYNNQLVPGPSRDRSAFTFLLPKEGGSLFVCSIVPERERDFLGIFASNIRFSRDLSAAHGIRGPIDNLWLDYSQVTSTLNQMQVSEPGASTNVRIQWELVSHDIGAESCTSWRASVRATKSIMPLDPLIRVVAQQE